MKQTDDASKKQKLCLYCNAKKGDCDCGYLKFRGFKYAVIRPTEQQLRDLKSIKGACRAVYNLALESREAHYRLEKEAEEQGTEPPEKLYLYGELKKWQAQEEYKWLADIPRGALDSVFRNLRNAYKRYFDALAKQKRGETTILEVHHPTAKTKKSPVGIKFASNIETKGIVDLENTRVWISPSANKATNVGWLHFRMHRPLPANAKIKSITLTKRGDKWFVSLGVVWKSQAVAPICAEPVGIDVGVVNTATLSTQNKDGKSMYGENYMLKNLLKPEYDKLKRLQRKLAGQQKNGKNWEKQKAKITRQYARIADVRKDFLNKITRTIVNEFPVVAMEKLLIKNMTKSAKGTVENPGTKVTQKRGLNRSMLNSGLSTFRTMLTYKAEEMGGRVIQVNPAYTSRTCPKCQYTSSQNRPTQSVFLCVQCGYENHADVVGAINIHKRALDNTPQ